ncbi:MAG: type II/IV secretion system protein [Ignavibacteriae bacterium]|nr:type II/IV secretion system protein [Ignavibacteriota bacterium]
MPESITITEDLSSILSQKFAFENCVLPLKIEANKLHLAVPSKFNIKLINDVSFETGYEIKAIEYPTESILSKLKILYPNKNGNGNEIVTETLDSEHSNVEYVNQAISNAISLKASDIHFESLEKLFRIRYRIDGQLREVSSLPNNRSLPIASRLKIMANLDISEKRRPQDGRIKFNFKGTIIDIRVSSIPTSFGEKIVLRILDKSQLNLDLRTLGLSDHQYNILTNTIVAPYGMVLVTGPTGSGKTTTLYAALKHIHTSEKNIITIEDPIEYNIDGINQCNVKHDIGFDFANALRSFLRQDPNVIMVGEIRDKETAEIAIRASLTGHLVFSTLHTNDSLSAITRLIDMGVEPFLVSASVKLIVAQRLVRKLCRCKEIKKSDANNFEDVVVPSIDGCEKCNYVGYKGRTAIYELLEINDDLRELITERASSKKVKEIALKNGLITLRQSGMEKIKNGITSYEEVLRETT